MLSRPRKQQHYVTMEIATLKCSESTGRISIRFIRHGGFQIWGDNDHLVKLHEDDTIIQVVSQVLSDLIFRFGATSLGYVYLCLGHMGGAFVSTDEPAYNVVDVNSDIQWICQFVKGQLLHIDNQVLGSIDFAENDGTQRYRRIRNRELYLTIEAMICYPWDRGILQFCEKFFIDLWRQRNGYAQL